MNLFYSTSINAAEITLTDEEARHCTQVLRYKVGDAVWVTDGIGGLYETKIGAISKKNVLLNVTKKALVFNNKQAEIHIACAPTKNIDRYEWFIEKATEIGMTALTPLACFQSERRQVRHDRLHKVVVSAAKQSLKYTFPVLNDLIDFKLFIQKNANFAGQKFIAHCHEDIDKKILKNEYDGNSNALILIGPEGDFSVDEVRLAQQHGFVGVSISDSRLRTETAAVVAVHTLNLLQP